MVAVVPAEVLAQRLINLGVGSINPSPATGFAVRVADDPQQYDQTIVLFDSGAELDGVMLRTGESIQHPTVQVRVKAKDYRQGQRKAQEAATLLAGTRRVVVTVANPGPSTPSATQDVTVQAVTLITGIGTLGRDEKNLRWLFSFNLKATFLL